MKKTYLVKLNFLVELDEEKGENEDYFEQHIFNKLGEDLLLNGSDKVLEAASTSSLQLDPASMNCGRCANCKQWATDREQPDALTELRSGATYRGELLCDECLPKRHRWAF